MCLVKVKITGKKKKKQNKINSERWVLTNYTVL